MKPSGSDGIDLGRCLHPRSGKNASTTAGLFQLTVASGRGLREDQWRDALLVAGRRSRRRGAGILCSEATRLQSHIEIPQKINETLWKSKCHRDGQTAFLRWRNESNRQCQKTRNGPVAEQPGGEFTPAISTTGTSDAAVLEYAKFAEIRRCPCLCTQPFQPGTLSLKQDQFQADPRRHCRRVASTWRGITGSATGPAETGSHWSYSTIGGPYWGGSKAMRNPTLLPALSGWRPVRAAMR
jgi:hypothetical protein